MSRKGLAGFLIKRFIKDPDDSENPQVRAKYGLLGGWLSITVNLVIFAFKLGFGLLLNSIALIADAFHTMSDMLGSGLVLLGFKMGQKPPDARHPHGHGRFEAVAALVIALLIFAFGIGLVRESFERLREAPVVLGSFFAASFMIAVALIKEWMARFSQRIGQLIGSTALRADGWHHRCDALASVVVAIGLVVTRLGFTQVDAVIGLLVSAFIVYTGLDIFKNSVSVLLGEAPNSELEQRIKSTAKSVSGVKGVHKLNVHDYGLSRKATLHVIVDKDLNVEKSHAIAMSVKAKIRKSVPGTTTEVHVEPHLAEEGKN